jgi:16S rRNA C1402 (ribose-2'-O) methylase RsmI
MQHEEEDTGGRKRVAVMKELRSDVRKKRRGDMNQVGTDVQKERMQLEGSIVMEGKKKKWHKESNDGRNK